MVWNGAQFNSLVKRTEQFACKHPKFYRLQVALFADLGYLYLLLVLAFLLSPSKRYGYLRSAS